MNKSGNRRISRSAGPSERDEEKDSQRGGRRSSSRLLQDDSPAADRKPSSASRRNPRRSPRITEDETSVDRSEHSDSDDSDDPERRRENSSEPEAKTRDTDASEDEGKDSQDDSGEGSNQHSDQSDSNEMQSGVDEDEEQEPLSAGDKKKTPNGARRSITNGDNHMDTPVREITIKKKSQDSSGKKHKLSASDLDEQTFQLIKEYLEQQKYYTKLNDDEVAMFMIRMNRVSQRQAEYHQNLVGDSDDSVSTLLNDILGDEEEYAVGHEWFKNMVSSIKEDHPEYDLDPRTLGWIKRAAGMHRSSAEVQLREAAIEAENSRSMKTRMTTRRSRAQKREKGLSELVNALADIEEEFGPFEKRKKRKSIDAAPLTYHADDDHSVNRRSRRLELPLQATIKSKNVRQNGESMHTSKDLLLARIILDGKTLVNLDSSVSVVGEEESVSEQTRHRGEVSIASVRSGRVNLRTIDWDRRTSTTLYTRPERSILSDPSYLEVVDDECVPQAFRKAEICYRRPRWSSLIRKNKDAFSANPPRTRHTNKTYASIADALMKAVRGKARSWATAEFFYSDLDSGWYNTNPFAEDVAKLGIDPHLRLTRREWKAIRRRIGSRPRRFSNRFLASQMNERNQYRNNIRLLQRNPGFASTFDFPYDVPAPIRVGSVVTALSKRYRIIQRGVVLSYDEANARYLVLFENREYGSEYCPDSEIASHGGYETLIPKAPRSLLHERRDSMAPSSIGVKDPSKSWTQKEPVTYKKQVSDALCFEVHKPQTGSSELTNSTPEELAEREMLTTVVATLDAALKRKGLLMNSLDQLHYESSDQLVVDTDEHIAWIWANLEHTNEIIQNALRQMRLLYGKTYLSVRHASDRSKKHELITQAYQQLVEAPSPSIATGDKAGLELARKSESLASKLVHQISAEAETEETDVVDSSERLASASQLLFTVSCNRDIASGTTNVEPMQAAMSLGMEKLLSLPDMPDAGEEDLYDEVRHTREHAAEEVREAITLLRTELMLSTLRDRIGKLEEEK